MTLPTIHMNGTSAADLLEDNCKAGCAIQAAIRALEHAGPNGRDYYTQGPQALRAAQDEHQARVEKLAGVLAELQAMADYIVERMP